MYIFKDPPQRNHIGTNAILHTRKIANKILERGKLWKSAKDAYKACHDWDLIRRMIDAGAIWKGINDATYFAYWGFSQNDFKSHIQTVQYHL